MKQTCQHYILSRANRVCGSPAKFTATLPNGKVMLVCARHGNSLASRHLDRVTFAEVSHG